MPSWSWSDALGEERVAAEDVTHTDHTDTAELVRGYEYADPLRSGDLVAYWPCHEDSGGIANDIAGSGISGMTSGGVVQGVTGIAGSTAYAYGQSQTEFTGATFPQNIPWSATCWVDNGSSPSDNDTALASLDNAGGGRDRGGFTFEYHASANSVSVAIGSGSRYLNVDGTRTITDGAWHMVTAAHDSSGNLTLWIDDVDQGTTQTQGVGDADNSLTAGTNPAFGGGWGGEVSEIRLYSAALTQSDVDALYGAIDQGGSWLGDGRGI